MPEEVAVVGFDDSVAAGLAVPPLTTVRQPIVDMGAEMARMLLGRVFATDGAGQRVIVDTELVVRGSS